MTELKDWIGVVGTLAGALAGGLIALIVSHRQFRHQRALEREKRQLANFEHIHRRLSMVADQAGILAAQLVAHVGGGPPFNMEALGEKVPIDELRMLVDFYAPGLRPEVEQVTERFLALGRSVAEAIATQRRTDEWKANIVVAATTASADVREASVTAKEKLRALVGSYTDSG
jgi:HAMP domain-containing protein